MVAFGNASGYVHTLDIKKHINTKGLFFTRPSIAHYTVTRKELEESAQKFLMQFYLENLKLKFQKNILLVSKKSS